jgi:hypothetical protein
MLCPRCMPRKFASRCQGICKVIAPPPSRSRSLARGLTNCCAVKQDFFRPIVTPMELELALQPSPTWIGNYVLDFNEVLARGPSKPSSDKGDENEDEDPDRPIFSLVTGKYRHAKRYGGERLWRAFWLFSVLIVSQGMILLLLGWSRHRQLLWSEIRTKRSRYSRTALLVMSYRSFPRKSTRLILSLPRRIPTITHVPWPRNACGTRSS